MNRPKKVVCVVPVYNDWMSFDILSDCISDLQKKYDTSYLFSIVAVNDGSIELYIEKVSRIPITILDLKTNIGHQRAIAVGLQYVYNEMSDYDSVVVMDSDGEDKPNDIIFLLEKLEEEDSKKIIFAERNKRKESYAFKTGYFFYRYLFYLLTGQKISFGNFSAIPMNLLKKVVYQGNLWNHFSGGIIQSKIPFSKVLLDRGKRFKGVSKMNFNNLIIHGLSSIAVYFDILSVRILKFSIFGILMCIFSVLVIFYQKIFTDVTIPGWASSLVLIISGIILQLFSVTLIVLLMQLSSRKNIIAPSAKTYLNFIEKVRKS